MFRSYIAERLPQLLYCREIVKQKFNSSVLKYLDIKNPPSGINVLMVEHINSISDQKAIYQVILEYLILQNSDSYDETELQQSFLDAFNLNSTVRASISKYVELLYSATGAEGLAEKYGYVVEEETENVSADNKEKDSSEEEKRLEKEAALLLLNEREAYRNYIQILKDYIWFRDGGEDYVINKRSCSKEKIDWLSSLRVSDNISFDNLCCVVDYNCDKTYFLDFDAHRFHSLNISERIKLLAMNQQWLIAIDHSNNVLIYDFYSHTIDTLNATLNGIKPSAYIFGDTAYFIDYSKVCSCNLISKEYKEIFDAFEINDEIKNKFDINGSIEDSLIYNNKLYLLGSIWTSDDLIKHYIYSIDLDNPSHFENVCDNIYAYRNGFRTALFKYDSGWILITEDYWYCISPKFNLSIFSCETNDIHKIAIGCGEQHEIKTGLFKNKTEFLYETLRFFKWNNFLFFEQDAGSYRCFNACVNINEPMHIIVAE